MIRCLIVDDEPLALDILENYIQRVPSLSLVRRCSNALEAYDFLQQESVDLMFLDIHMPELTGIDFLKALTRRPLVVFTTAYSNYALDGFNLDITDYLLKPIAFDRFLKAVDKAAQLLMPIPSSPAPAPAPAVESPPAVGENKTPGTAPSSTENSNSPGGEDHFFAKVDGKMIKVRLDDIRIIEGMKDYVQIHLADQRLVIHQTMKGMEKALPSERFLRIHRSYIVALAHIEAVHGNQVDVSGQSLPVGANHRDELLAYLQRHNLTEN